MKMFPLVTMKKQTSIFIHVADATHQEFRKILIRSNDSDVVVIAVSCIQDLHLDELWVAYGTGKAYIYIPGYDKPKSTVIDSYIQGDFLKPDEFCF